MVDWLPGPAIYTSKPRILPEWDKLRVLTPTRSLDARQRTPFQIPGIPPTVQVVACSAPFSPIWDINLKIPPERFASDLSLRNDAVPVAIAAITRREDLLDHAGL